MNKLLIDEDKVYSITGSYEFYKDYSVTRENLEEMDWDIVSVQIDYADIDFIREFKDLIRWDLVDYDTIQKWKIDRDPRYAEFRHYLEDAIIDEKLLEDRLYIEDFVKKLMKEDER